MLFEIRDSVPDVSPEWVEVRDLLLQGQSRRAWEMARARRKTPGLASGRDYVLNAEIARACSAKRTYMALIRRAFRQFPQDPFVQLYHARVLLTRNRHMMAIDFLLDHEASLGRTHRVFWGTELAGVYANAGFEASCRRWLESVHDLPGIDSPLALYTQSCAYEGLQQWDEAIELAQRCVDAAPNWSRVRAYLACCLLSRGRISEAEEEIREAERRGHQESAVDVAAAMLTLSLGRFDEARVRFEALLTDWPQADFSQWVRRTLCILLVEMGDQDRARQVAGGEEEKLALPSIPAELSGRHCILPLPLVAQNKNQCLPTSVAMAAWPQGGRLDADALFREMHGREGTALWRMRQWVNQHGFRLVPVRLQKEAIVELLELGIPLVGALEGPFGSHVDVICGHREDLDVLYVRDPGHWGLLVWPWEMAVPRYEMHSGVMAIIDARRDDARNVAERWRSEECGALMDLAEAIAQGRVSDAEAAYARIEDRSPAACLRDNYAVNVVISPARFVERMKAIAADPQANMCARFRAMMVLGPENIGPLPDELFSTAESDRYWIGIHRCLLLQKRMGEGQWQVAQSIINQLLLTGGGVASFWELNSDILAELGKHDESRLALERAIELEPLGMSLREKSLRRAMSRLTLDEYLKEFDALLAEDPEDKRLLIGRAEVLRDGPDGYAYEEAVREALRRFPRDPSSHWDLATWYQYQGRDDKAEEQMEQAKTMLPDIFGPPSSADSSEPAESRENPDLGGNQHQPAEAIPEEKEQLLDLAGKHGEPRRAAALAKLLELEDAGQLHWHERARLLSSRLLIPDDPDSDSIDCNALLPVPVPAGASHWFAQAVCDQLTGAEPTISVALAVNEWLDRVVTDVRNYPDLWFERVLLLEHGTQMERALAELRELLERYPATSSALFRMGVVKYQQDDYASARHYLERALEVNPGLVGAMDVLRRVHEVLGNQAEMLLCTRMLRKKYPYSMKYLAEEVLAVAELESDVRALELIDSVADEFPQRRIQVLRARAHLAADRTNDAARVLAGVQVTEEDDEDLYDEYLNGKLSIALRRDDTTRVLEICEQGLRRWPGSTPFKEIQAEHLAGIDPHRSRALLREVLYEGEPKAQTAWQYLRVAEGPPDTAARDVIQAAPRDRQAGLAELFSHVMSAPDLLSWNCTFLEWALAEYPESDELRWQLTSHYCVNDQATKAVELAEELHRRNPDNPEALRMLGRCLVDVDAQKALLPLEQACQQNRSADYLSDLARCYQVVGNTARATQLYWEILEHNPYQSCSWANLYILGASRGRLWPLLLPMLDRGCGVDAEYFLVAAVRIAVERRERLPANWWPLALDRWEIMKTHPGFRDERRRLLRALLVWCRVRPADVDGSVDLPRSLSQALFARFLWPGCRWVPAE